MLFRVSIQEEVTQNASKWLETEKIIITTFGDRQTRKKKNNEQFSVFSLHVTTVHV